MGFGIPIEPLVFYGTFVAALGYRGSIRALLNISYIRFGSELPPFFNSRTRSAYRNVFSVCSQLYLAGEMLATISDLALPMNESLSTCVSLEPRNGVCLLSISRARIHSLSASNDLLISAPSIRVYFPFSAVSAPRSLPARSINEALP